VARHPTGGAVRSASVASESKRGPTPRRGTTIGGVPPAYICNLVRCISSEPMYLGCVFTTFVKAAFNIAPVVDQWSGSAGREPLGVVDRYRRGRLLLTGSVVPCCHKRLHLPARSGRYELARRLRERTLSVACSRPRVSPVCQTRCRESRDDRVELRAHRHRQRRAANFRNTRYLERSTLVVCFREVQTAVSTVAVFLLV